MIAFNATAKTRTTRLNQPKRRLNDITKEGAFHTNRPLQSILPNKKNNLKRYWKRKLADTIVRVYIVSKFTTWIGVNYVAENLYKSVSRC